MPELSNLINRKGCVSEAAKTRSIGHGHGAPSLSRTERRRRGASAASLSRVVYHDRV
jgi:hypothetical protein